MSRKLLFLLLLAFWPSYPQDTAPKLTTYNCANGRLWKGMMLGEKLSFLRGLNEGISESAGPLDIFFVSSERPGERVEALDHVFAEPENILIPIRSALRWHVKKLKGASQSEVDGDLSALREWALAAPENK